MGQTNSSSGLGYFCFTRVRSNVRPSSTKMKNDRLLNVEPLELKMPFELNKKNYCCMVLTNNTDKYVAFKVKTTNPEKYSVRPNKAVVLPGNTCQVTVGMLSTKQAPQDYQCKDKFLIQSIVVKEGSTVDDIKRDMFMVGSGKAVQECKLNMVFFSANQTSPIPEKIEDRAHRSALLGAPVGSRSYEERSRHENSETTFKVIDKSNPPRTHSLNFEITRAPSLVSFKLLMPSGKVQQYMTPGPKSYVHRVLLHLNIEQFINETNYLRGENNSNDIEDRPSNVDVFLKSATKEYVPVEIQMPSGESYEIFGVITYAESTIVVASLPSAIIRDEIVNQYSGRRGGVPPVTAKIN